MKKKKSLSKLKEEAWSLFSARLKQRYADDDGNVRCFTCGAIMKLNTTNCQGGHYLSRGGYPGLTFHPDNSRPQCYRCNVHLKGNTVEFRIRLIEEIGLERVEALEAQRHNQVKLTRSDYEKMIEELKNNSIT